MTECLGGHRLNRVSCGDCLAQVEQLPDDSIDVIVTSPPYWGQRTSGGLGVEEDPRAYLSALVERFAAIRRVLKPDGLLWVNVGDAYNTPINWRFADYQYSSLGPEGEGLDSGNSAYTKTRHQRKAFINGEAGWLQYGNLLALPYRLVVGLCDRGFLFRGEVIWRKANPMPEGKCRRPHRAHEPIYLFAKTERHQFQVTPAVKSVWEFPNEASNGVRHFSRFPRELPLRCIQAYGKQGPDVIVLDPFSGSGTTGVAAISLGCSYVGFEVDPALAVRSNELLARIQSRCDAVAENR